MNSSTLREASRARRTRATLARLLAPARARLFDAHALRTLDALRRTRSPTHTAAARQHLRSSTLDSARRARSPSAAAGARKRLPFLSQKLLQTHAQSANQNPGGLEPPTQKNKTLRESTTPQENHKKHNTNLATPPQRSPRPKRSDALSSSPGDIDIAVQPLSGRQLRPTPWDKHDPVQAAQHCLQTAAQENHPQPSARLSGSYTIHSTAGKSAVAPQRRHGRQLDPLPWDQHYPV